MRVLFWRRSPLPANSSTASKTADSSAIAGVSPPPWVERTDRRASRFALLAKIAAWGVVFGVILEEWDILGIAWKRRFPYLIREAAGGLIVAGCVALEIRFSSLEARAERKIRDWYAVRVAELNVELEQERVARVKIQERVADAHIKATALEIELQKTKQSIPIAEQRAVQAAIHKQEERKKRTPDNS